MVNGKGASKPYVSFLSNAATDVTGSMHLVRFKKYVTLLDCGLIQLNDPMSTYKANREQMKKIKPHEVDYVILSHIHADHSSNIPSLFAKGCNAHVYVPKGAIPILKLLWLDSMKIMQGDCLKLQRKHGMKATPFYDEQDIEKALNRCIEVDYHEKYQMNKDMSFTYYPAGHIVYSAQILLEMTEGNIIKRVGFTGDIGGYNERPFTIRREPLPFCNLLIGENTYNVEGRHNSPKDRANDRSKIKTIIGESNKILFPCFSLQRTAELLMVLDECGAFEELPVYLDSPLASKICAIWEDETGRFDQVMAKVKQISSWEESVALQHKNEHCIIISASGFLSGGRIMAHLITALSHSNNHLVFIGYAGENNLASKIKSNQKKVEIDGLSIPNKIKITELRSFSSHANYDDLMQYYGEECRYNSIALVHGEYEYKGDFCKALKEKLVKNCKAARVICVNNGQRTFI